MITQETAGRIWDCYREIEAGEHLLADMEAAAKENKDNGDDCAPSLRDVFGRKRNLELGVPAGRDCHRLLMVSPELGETVIRAHIARMKGALADMNERARIELDQ